MRGGAWTALWLSALWAVGASAASPDRVYGQRTEALALIRQVDSGGSAQAAANRIRFLEQESFVIPRVAKLLEESFEPRRRANLVLLLSLIANRSAERLLLGLLDDSDAAVRMTALQGLERVPSRAVDVMLPQLADKTLGVRRAAARALGASRVPKVGKPLVEAAKLEGEPEVRAAMLVAVGQSGDKRQAKALESYLDSSSEGTRYAAARGLCLLGSARGFAFVEERLASQDRFERQQGLALVEGLEAKSAHKLLAPLVHDADSHIAARAARMLAQGGDASMTEWLVLASARAVSADDKLVFENELEHLRLPDDARQAILRKGGLR